MTQLPRPILFVCAIFFALLEHGSAQSQVMNPWTQYLNTNQCSMTRGNFLAIAQANPGYGWILSPGNVTSDTFAAAAAVLDTLRLSMAQADTPFQPSFKSHCCKVQIWQNSSSGASVIVPSGGNPGFGFMPNSPDMCCEDAAFTIGFDPLGCTAVPLMSVPGATVTMTPAGPISQIGPITIATSPPVSVTATGISAAITTTTTTTGGGVSQFIGCFNDPNNPFDLDGYLERSGENTPERCVETCKNNGFRYAGVQYGMSCLCGNQYGKFGPASNCDMACTGDSAKICGGYNANSVYSTGL